MFSAQNVVLINQTTSDGTCTFKTTLKQYFSTLQTCTLQFVVGNKYF